MKFETFLESTLADTRLTSSDRIYFGMQMEDFEGAEEQIHDYKTGHYFAKEQKRDHSHFKILHNLVSSTPLNREYVVYRAFGGAYDRTKLKVGQTIKDSNFMSSSLRWSVARQFINPGKDSFNDKNNWIAKITLPKGTKAFYLDIVESKHDKEQQLLINKGVALKITGFSEVNGIHIGEMTA